MDHGPDFTIRPMVLEVLEREVPPPCERAILYEEKKTLINTFMFVFMCAVWECALMWTFSNFLFRT